MMSAAYATLGWGEEAEHFKCCAVPAVYQNIVLCLVIIQSAIRPAHIQTMLAADRHDGSITSSCTEANFSRICASDELPLMSARAHSPRSPTLCSSFVIVMQASKSRPRDNATVRQRRTLVPRRVFAQSEMCPSVMIVSEAIGERTP
jgi:hypothetical protein